MLYYEGRPLCISVFLLPSGKEKRDLSKGTTPLGRIALATDQEKLVTGWALVQVQVLRTYCWKKKLHDFLKPSFTKVWIRRELPLKDNWSRARSSCVTIWRSVQDVVVIEKSRKMGKNWWYLKSAYSTKIFQKSYLILLVIIILSYFHK